MNTSNSEIVAYKTSEHPDTKLALDTLSQLDNLSENTILHSDQDLTYTSWDFFELARKKGVIRSMSRKGNTRG